MRYLRINTLKCNDKHVREVSRWRAKPSSWLIERKVKTTLAPGRYFHETKVASKIKKKKDRRKINTATEVREREREKERERERNKIICENIISLSRLTLIGELAVCSLVICTHEENTQRTYPHRAWNSLDYCRFRGNFSSRQFAIMRIIQLRKFEVKRTIVKHAAWLFAGDRTRAVAFRASSAKNRQDI